jgi:ketosteroid isomerase-like protein
MRQPAHPTATETTVHPEAVVATYLDAFYSGDLETAASLLAEDFCFQGPTRQIEGKQAFLDRAEGVRSMLRGDHRVRQWVDGNEICTLHEAKLVTSIGEGSVLVSEWHSVRDGQLVSGQSVFDTTAFRALVPAPPPDLPAAPQP